MFFKTAFTLCMAIVLASLSIVASPASAGGKLVVGHDSWIGYSGVFIADAKGFFKEAGIEVELKRFPGPGDSPPALIAGHLDVVLTTLHNLVLVAGNDPGVNLKTVYLIDSSNGADGIVSKTSINRVADLKGKKVAVTVGEANEFFLITALEKAGLKMTDIQPINVSADDAGAAFLAGNVDAAVTWEPWLSKATTGGGKVLYSSKDLPDLIINAIVATEKTLQTRPDDVRAFVQAVDRGVQYLKDHPDEGMEIVAKKLEASPEDCKGMLAGDKIYSIADNATLLGDVQSGTIGALMRNITTFLSDRELIKSKPDVASLVDNTFVK
ncbi:MAG TPA: ABC transporter substrate-binding protein [Tepidisphaeraceae bacterium]|jgi:NitT/TauT family transport system substrate-binding protein|nr:ABC transporter substrate-binding protein [Tepidisphaeraceae bacterium]